ncbi:hypothetical protein SCE1572_42405 [Sorangium cellulosum So0157-2]|uniref:Uncharacterized protein n=1 Tax=Sorangium cellulosum So0157-2 TaxID=1254432 RepID=S4Y8K5_SORCE|nr:hypothetical protein SCE1572_42405 [Sorangium cellulosum So0157-2]
MPAAADSDATAHSTPALRRKSPLASVMPAPPGGARAPGARRAIAAPTRVPRADRAAPNAAVLPRRSGIE